MRKQYTERLKKVEEQLERVLPEHPTKEWKILFAGPFAAEPEDISFTFLHKPALDLLSRGGKRWRPILMLLSGEMAGNGEEVLPLTPLVELAHNGTLMVDDIEDGADTRRGEPAVHLRYGVDICINTANYLYFLPARIIDTAPVSEDKKLLLYQYYTQDMRLLHIGQGMDIHWHNQESIIPNREQYFQMCRYKTGGLARFAGRAGFALGGGSLEKAELLGKICEEIGVAFQIIDDVKNLTTGNPGKTRGDDILEGKKSLPVILFGENPEADRSRLSAIFTEIKGTQQRGESHLLIKLIDEAISLLAAGGTIDKAETIAKELLDRSRNALIRNFSPSTARKCLEFMMESFL